MPLSLQDIEFLRSDRANMALVAHTGSDLSEDNTLRLLARLRESLTMQEASAVLQTLKLRLRAEAKFPQHARDMLFTDDGLQQASHPATRRYRAGLLAARTVLDLCCGIGSDSMAFAAAGRQVLGQDIDPVRIAIARHNAEVMGLAAEFAVADVRQSIPAGYDCVYYDPSRRDARGRRIHQVERYQPPLSLLRDLKAREAVVKLSPAVDVSQLESYGGRLEFISVDGNLTEALLWLHRRSGHPFATKLVGDAVYQLFHQGEVNVAIAPPKRWLFEPDAAVLRAGLVQHLALDLNATMLDESIAYLTMDERRDTPWGRYWQVLDWMPFQLKRLRRYLVERGVRRLTVKKRGFAMSPEALIARLRLKHGGESRVLVLTRHRDRPIAIICATPPFG